MIHLLYIDPGTGSMLFSVAIGAVAAGYFLLQALWIKLKVAISGGRARVVAKNHHPYVIYCEGKQYWNVFKPVLDEFESRAIELVYLTSAEDDPVFVAQYHYIKSEYIGEGNKAFARLNFLSADVVLMTTPGLDVYQMKRSKNVRHYAHIVHMAHDATRYELFGIDYYDSVLLTGEHQVKDIRFLEKLRGLAQKQLLITGCTYLDAYNQKIQSIQKDENHIFTVLVSPTWGSSGLLALYGEKLLDPLLQTGWRIIVRPHPQSKKSDAAVLEKLQGKYKDAPNIEWDYEGENIYSLAKADAMISDFSGIMFDYMFLFNKPVFYCIEKIDLGKYDAYFVPEEMWQLRTIRDIAIELKEEMFASIKDVITQSASSMKLHDARKKASETAWRHKGEAGKNAADFMIEKRIA